MHYHLSFLDDAGRAQEMCTQDFETDGTAKLWMLIVGAERALHTGWSLMELRCQGRCIARVPAQVLRQAWKTQWQSWRDL
jgi:hypothetical protein